eukprot:TRINITY_DN65631_c0_g1_i1.p1 TRINITY_DN65631_c0_g1~~TRINITY_DN65631_c0_g1_i1.p1  ORF type:complete len:579 (+),score=210.52 TRINITY_DN65631_c0_g1_i1:72-1739(+)
MRAALLLLAAAAAAQSPLPGPSPFPHDTVWQLWTDITDEVFEPHCTPVNGSIPRWLQGVKWGNGFGKFGGNRTRFGKQEHWDYNFIFDTLAIIWKWDIDGSSQRVCFQNRLQRTHAYNRSLHEIPPYMTFGGTDPQMAAAEKAEVIKKAMSPGPDHDGGGGDNLGVNIQPIGGEMMAVSDMSGEMIIDQQTAANTELVQWNDSLSIKMPVLQSITCAHPTHMGKWTWNYKVHMMDLHDLTMNEYVLYRIDNTKKPLQREVVLKWKVHGDGFLGWPTFMHQFAVTENYVVFMEWPLFWDFQKVVPSMEINNAFAWKPENGTRVQVIKYTDDGKGELVHTLWTDAFFAYHHINAFEDGKGNIVLDVSTWKNADHLLGGTFDLKKARAGTANIPPGNTTRFIVPATPEAGSQIQVRSTATSVDLAVVDQGNPGDTRRRGKPYKWAYGITGLGDNDWWNTIVKVDADTGLIAKQVIRVPHWPSEPVFVPRPGATADDDGVVLVQMNDASTQLCYLLGLDAHSFEEVFSVYSPVRCTFMSHGSFLPRGYSPTRPWGVMTP